MLIWVTVCFKVLFLRNQSISSVSLGILIMSQRKHANTTAKKNKNSLYVNYSDHTFPFPCGIPKGQCFTAPSKAATAKL